jgi:Protein of unknown function (DUF1326)
MRRILLASMTSLALLILAVVPGKAAIEGNYLEVRNADVWTGPCFANSQVGLAGKQAILAWKVTEGGWEGINLQGLSIVAVIKASATLGDPFHDPYPAESVLIVDRKATPRQREALESFAESRAGRLLSHVVRVDVASIDLTAGTGANHGEDVLTAGNLALVKTRALCQGDIICGNEAVYYPPLTKIAHPMPAFTEMNAFSGKGLGVVWINQDSRSAFVGTFSD